MAHVGSGQLVERSATRDGGSSIRVLDMPRGHVTRHRVPFAGCPDGSCRPAIDDAYLLVGKAHDAANIIGAVQGGEAGAMIDFAEAGIAYDASHKGSTLDAAAAIDDEVGNDGTLQDVASCHAHKAQTVEALIAMGDAADAVTIAVEHTTERIGESA